MFGWLGRGAFWENAGWVGRSWTMGVGARAFQWPPLRLARLRCERGSVDVVLPTASPIDRRRRGGRVEGSGVGRSPRLLRGRDRRGRRAAVAGPGRDEAGRARVVCSEPRRA